MNELQKLAKEMNVTENDLSGFVSCLRVWIAKGYTIEQAIEKHMAQMTRLAEHSGKMDNSLVVDAFFPA